MKSLQDWSVFSISRNISPYLAKEEDVIGFLRKYFSTGAAYGSVNSAKSAIALVLHNPWTNLMQRFMKSIFRERPPKPKYDKIWDIDPVLEKLASWPAAESLDLSRLTSKLVVLMAIGTTQRIQSLSLIKISNIVQFTTGFEIRIPDPIKTSRPGAAQPLILLRFEESLCVAGLLRAYLEKTKTLRGESVPELFITTKKPYKAASSATISRWIKSTLVLCGVEDSYTAYSTRHASSSAALKKGINLDRIKQAAGWSERSKTFQVL